MRLTTLTAVASFLAIGGASLASCSLGEGQGSVTGTLDVADCWSGPFNLQPNFFAAVPYDNTLELRIQSGDDYETFSDGVEILIDNLSQIRGTSGQPSLYGQPMLVSIPAGVAAPGVPIAANSDPSIVHLTLYLNHTCPTQDVALFALESVSLNPEGGCNPRDGGEPQIVCPGAGLGIADDAGLPVLADAGAGEAGAPLPPIGHSTITFTSLFDGNEDEVAAAPRLNQGTFQVYLADPREACPGGGGPPPPCRGYLQGSFNFYFERGQGAQPFP